MTKTNAIMPPSLDGSHLSASHPMRRLKAGTSKRPLLSFMPVDGKTLSPVSVQATVGASRLATASEALLFQREAKS